MQSKFEQFSRLDIADLTFWQKTFIAIFALIILTLIFYFSPVPSGLDWHTIREGLWRFLTGKEIYQMLENNKHGYFYPPWTTAVLSPLAFFPEKIGWALTNSISLLGILALARRFKLTVPHIVLLMVSPPMFYNLMQGQVDIIMMLLIFLPREWWPVFALSKPQVVLGLGFGIIRHPARWLRAIIISSNFIILSFILYGFWPARVIELSILQYSDSSAIPQNLLGGLWPLQLILAVTLISIGIDKDEERFLLAASPFMLKYASSGSYIGVLLALFSALKWWQAFLIILTWWGIMASTAI